MQHDACGVGFIARPGRSGAHEIVRHGLTALVRLAHRGAPASLGAVDGCGIMTDIPWGLVDASLAERPPAGRTRALGMVFVAPAQQHAAMRLVEGELTSLGASVAWRTVPIDRSGVLRAQRDSIPAVLQAVIALNDGARKAEDRLYRARLRIERRASVARIRLAIVSLSTATVVYKGLVAPDALDRFYRDLTEPQFASRFALFHQRFSTNTTADWTLAQPFRLVAHNGEINTIGGNRSWMRARMLDAMSLPGFRGLDPLAAGGSDSRSLDDAVELLRQSGYSIAHALSRLVPPAWERDRDLPPDIRAFHEFQSLVGEPWDGPSALAFADGRFVGAALDRNGFRPARIVRTADGLIAVASEAGVLASADHDIVDRSRLGPGEMVMVDLVRGHVARTNEIRRRLALRRPYKALVAATVRSIASCLDPAALEDATASSATPDRSSAALTERQIAFGCSREEIELILKPMAAGAHEAVGSMGDDTPPAALSRRTRLFTDFFRQRFAQVTNPAIDPHRESGVMSLTTLLGGHGQYLDELAARPTRIALRSPILTRTQFAQLTRCAELAPVSIRTTFEARGGFAAFTDRVAAIANEAAAAVEAGSALLMLSDEDVDANRAAVPALLAVAAVHQTLLARGLRTRASIVVDSGDARDAHQLAALCAFGASAVCPSLGYDTVAAISPGDATGCERPIARYRLALERGLLTILSKMGVCTFASYCGSQLFEILGLDARFVDEYFRGAPAHAGHIGVAEIAGGVLDRHGRAFAAPSASLEHPGLHGYRRDGEYHATNPIVVRGLQRARDEHSAYETFTSHVYGRPPAAVRDLVEFKPARSRRPAEVEPIESICRRFFASAMSVGALSPEAHRTIALAMNRIGARSNSGEGGEERDRVERPRDIARWDGSRTKQIASARFGVTPAYLRSADELQIKIAQGSKPGEGGQLPGVKVMPHIAALRHAQPGTTLISPPVHHDIYSIEDLAQLIFDLRAFHPSARINVKLVASSGVGIVAAGVAKAGADAIQISGHDGGTGASPRASIKHAGLPWEIGVAEAHRALVAAGLRKRVVLQTDGGLKTGRDIAVAAALGADEYGFGTAALVAIGCVMARQCHANTCPVGIATQRTDLRDAFSGSADMLVRFLMLVAGEVREILATLGLRSMDDLVGRSDLLRARSADVPLDLAGVLRFAGRGQRFRAHVRRERREAVRPEGTDVHAMPRPIANTDRAFGADIAGAIAERCGDRGLPDRSVSVAVAGTAGQSFGAFALPGLRLVLLGDANDGVGKGMHGGEIVVAPPPRERGRSGQVLVGNAALYGATGGRLFVGGCAGERFAVRNSGAVAVVEGVGDHGCEYMTGGHVVVLGPVGRNFASGMTGGAAYVWDRRATLAGRTNLQEVSIAPLTEADRELVRDLLDTHARLTGSRVARGILRDDRDLTAFRRVSASSASPAAQAERPPSIEESNPPAAPAEPPDLAQSVAC